MMVGDRTVDEIRPADGDDAGERVVVVGVKFDSRSRELLTWALAKVARSGDRVVALYVIDPNTVTKSTLLALIKTFDSIFAAYEGLCNLKQVDLKLKICRGTSAQKVLVREAKCYGSANIVVGCSRSQHRIWPSLSVAKYCAKNLSNNFSIIAVDNGKILFRKYGSTVVCDSQVDYHCNHQCGELLSLSKSSKGLCKATANAAQSILSQLTSLSGNEKYPISVLQVKRLEFPESKPGWGLLRRAFLKYLSSNKNKNNAMALLPVNTQELPNLTTNWGFFRSVFLLNRQQTDKSSAEKTHIVQSVFMRPSRQSLATVYPDRKQNNSESNKCHSLEGLHEKYSSPKCRVFSYRELLVATSNFFPGNLVGKGGSSQVYRGCLPDGKEVAVKRMKHSEHVLMQFISEIEILINLSHKNVISLLGFCFEENNLLLVYSLIANGSLQENLHGQRKDTSTLGWEDRYKVALGVAEALDYLHNGVAEPIIHRDVKSSNILLSHHFEPQLSDFGLAMSRSSFSCHITTCSDVAGTFGYLAPEYFLHGEVNNKTDIYALGVVLLELLSGRRPIQNKYPSGQESLVMWAKPILKAGKVEELLLDSSLGIGYEYSDNIERMVLAATLCIRTSPGFRPETSIVLKILQGDVELIKWAREQVSAAIESESDDFANGENNIRSHLTVALQDLDDEDDDNDDISTIFS